jgi:hypothetical protein
MRIYCPTDHPGHVVFLVRADYWLVKAAPGGWDARTHYAGDKSALKEINNLEGYRLLAEAGWRTSPPGRKKRLPPEQRRVSKAVSLPIELWERLDRMAETLGHGRSEVVELLVMMQGEWG